MANMHFDKVLQQIGEKGPYQNFIFYLLCIPASITSAFLSFSQVFVSATPDHWCKIPFFINSTASPKLSPIEQRKIAIPYVDGKYDKCHMYSKYASNDGFSETDYISVVDLKPNSTWPIVKCPYGWNYDNTDYDTTLVTQFDLVCDQAWWPPFSTTLFFVGSLIGNVLFGWISDRWGRRTAFFLILIVDIVSTTAAAFSYNYEIYSILRLFSGMCFPALYQVSFILALELMGPHCRTMVGMVITTLFSLSMSFLAVLGYLVRDWYKLSLATSVPFIFIFSYFWILPESPRWLLSKNRLDEAEKIVQKIAQTNNKNIPLNFLRKLEEESSSLTGQTNFQSEPSDESVSVLEILKYRQTRLRFLIISFDWIAIAVVYNGLSYNVSNLGIGDHQAFFIGGLVEILSHFFTWYLMDLWGRRSVLFISMVVGGFACVCCMFVSEGSIWTTLTLAMIGKFGNAAAFGVFYVFVGELLPTVIRSQAMGFASFVGGIGLLGFPYIIRLGEYNRMYPLVVMGFLSLGGGLMIILLPETLHVNLPQTLEDGEAMKVQSYSFYLPKNHKGRNHSESKQKKDDSAIYNGTELEDLSHFTVNSVN